MAPGLDRQVPTPEVNNNYMNSSVMFPRGIPMPEVKSSYRKEMQADIPFGGGTTIPYLTRKNIVLSLMMGRSEN